MWAVRDRVLGTRCALKVLTKTAGEHELEALVREATALLGLEGLGVPRVLSFGTLEGNGADRRYMVRELVEGVSLDQVWTEPSAVWLEPLVSAAEKLTVLHRAGLLHGDVKPANVIASADGSGTLVDLGLAAPWREGGTDPRGLTPKYAAPELLAGGPLTVRAEVFALGATLAEGLARRGADLEHAARVALARVATRAQQDDPQKRYPSTGELASAIRVAANLEAKPEADAPVWPVLGIDAASHDLLAAARSLAPGEALAVVGERGAGRSTLLRRLAWSLGVEGVRVVLADAPRTTMTRRQALELEVQPPAVLAIDDADSLTDDTRDLVRAWTAKGKTRLVIVGTKETAASCTSGKVRTFKVPPLDADATADLLKRAMPSLSAALATHIAARTGRTPSALRAAVRALAGRAVVSERDIDEALSLPAQDQEDRPLPRPEEWLARAEKLVDIGRVADAQAQLDGFDLASASAGLRLRAAIALARIRTARGEPALAIEGLEAVANASASTMSFHVAMSRALLRAGRFADAIEAARPATLGETAESVEALAAMGVAQAYLGDDAAGSASLLHAARVAQKLGDARGEGFALGSLGIVHQRAGRVAEAKNAYESALLVSESASDASTVAATRLNLAGLAREQGDIARALEHLEATVDLGNRAGGLLAVQQARINLINLDLYLGRHARARAALDALDASADVLPGAARAQLTGCRAELAARTGDLTSAARLYEECAVAYDQQGRASDATEARLEGLFMRATSERSATSPQALLSEADALAATARGHEPLLLLVRGVVESRLGHDDKARAWLDESVERAKAAGQQERAVWALSTRARLAASKGLRVQARRDLEAALSMLEDTASRLPHDLREVFWDEPRRAALRNVGNVTVESVRDARMTDVSLNQPRLAEDKLARVLEIVRELATEHDLPRLLAKVTDHALALLGGEHGFVVLVNDDGTLEAHTARDRKGDDPHARFSRSVAEKVIETGEPVVAIRAREDERLAEAVSVHQLAIQSIACVPVRGAPPLGRPIGALYVETRHRPGARFNEELPILRAFADQAAIAIENARLLEENRAHTRELEAAHEKLSEALGRRTEQLTEARRDLHRVRAGLKSHFGYAGLVGTSAAMRKVYALIDRVKDADVPALVTGESGTGKEVVARAIHNASTRGKKSFTGVNCGAIPANLLESELFGHVRGAFTGAERDRKGLLRESEGGTLLLDEIGEMPLKMQASMLRALQEKMVRPVGGTKEEPVDVRIIAATNRDLEQMVREGTFREDLFYRLHVVELRVPPLRERTEDIPPLIDHFLSLFSARYRRDKKTISRDALRRLCAYDWPGNVRQLEHVLLNAWLMSEDSEIGGGDIQLPDQSRPSSSRSGGVKPAKSETEYRDSEKDRILRALAACNWNRVKAAELTGIPRRTFYRRLKEFGIL